MSVQTEINRLKANVSDSFAAAEELGATMPSTQNSDNLANAIRTIGGTVTDVKVNGSSVVSNRVANIDISGKQNANTAVTHPVSTQVGSPNQPVYVNGSGAATAVGSIKANLLRGGINSMINTVDAISINPAINGMGYAPYRFNATCEIWFDSFKMPINTNISEGTLPTIWLDGKNNTFLRFENIDNYCTSDLNYSSSKSYSVGDIVRVVSGNYKDFFKCIKACTGVATSNTTYWMDIGQYHNTITTHESTSNIIDFRKSRNVIEKIEVIIDFKTNLRYENGVSLYWRANNQLPERIKVEKYDNGLQKWLYSTTNEDRTPLMTLESSQIATTVYLGTCFDPDTGAASSGGGNQTKLRITLYPRDTTWHALTQIAVTGLVGGIEQTLLNRQLGNNNKVYGDFLPHNNGVLNIGNTSNKWNNVYANTFNGTATNASKVNNLTVETAVPANAKFTDTVYTHPATHPSSMITGLESAVKGYIDKNYIMSLIDDGTNERY